MIVKLKDLVRNPVLAGAAHGKRLLGQMLASIEEPAEPTPVFLDFAGIEIATASFLRESVLRFRDVMRGKRSTLYPVIANANDEIVDELNVLVGATGDALMTCRLRAPDRVTDPVLIGSLDPKQKVTFELVNGAGETDAGALMRENNTNDGVGQTAWNNRLAMLASMGLIVELPQGRTKRYRALLPEYSNGN